MYEGASGVACFTAKIKTRENKRLLADNFDYDFRQK